MYEIAIIAAMLVFNAFFAAYEMALASVSKARLTELGKLRAKGAESALFMKTRMAGALSVIQLGITLFGAVAAATGGAGIDEALSPFLVRELGVSDAMAEFMSLTTLVLPLSAITIIFGELVPKIFAIENKELVLLRLSPFMRFLFVGVSPLIKAMEYLTNTAVRFASRALSPGIAADEPTAIQEMRLAAVSALEQKLIGPMEARIVSSAAELSLKSVKDLLIPPSMISSIPITCSLQEALLRAHMDLHTRFPVTAAENEPANIKGYVNFKDIVTALKMGAATASVSSIVRPIEKIDCAVTASEALQRMIEGNVHMAVVTESGGKIIGLLAVQDIIRQLTGGISDEYDRLPAHLYPSGSGLIAGGAAKIKDIYGKLQLPVPDDADRLAAWVGKKIGRSPKGSEILKLEGLEILVRKTRRNKLLEAYIGRAGS
ncbi:MAG: CNNM domain-containing protein [Elusimicrobiales bacterium]|nr:CNNM domain-containing protein [Elusimicrobiales bacterium]